MPVKPALHTFCVAPMLDWTDRHCRYFLRLISKKALLYTEMVTTGALLSGDPKRHLAFSREEKPVALQLGGAVPEALAECARMAEHYGYDEVNLNVGCPSSRVQNGRFGACLMAEPALVAECVAAMHAAVSLPVTVKTRIGIDNQDSYAALHSFIKTVAEAGCQRFIIHARKAWLQGLSPKQNREVPPLRYDIVHQVVQDFSHLQIVLNGGITTLAEAAKHLAGFSGVMLGRAVYHNPYLLAEVDQHFYQCSETIPTRQEILQNYLKYIQDQLQEGVPLRILARPLFGLYQGLSGARRWRRHLSEHIYSTAATENVIKEAAKWLTE